MSADKLEESLYEVKTLISLYSEYARSAPGSEDSRRSTQQEMRVMKRQMLKVLAASRQIVHGMAEGVKP